MKRFVTLMTFTAVALAGLAGCADEAMAPVEGPGDEPQDALEPEVVGPESRLTVTDLITFTREESPGVAAGFNLDDETTEPGSDDSCGHGDMTSPEGETGIDNQLALITPLFDQVGLGAIEGFVQAAVEAGGLLIMWQVDGIDDALNDEEVTVRLRFGSGAPLLGTDGLLLSGQTFHLNPDTPDTEVPGYIEDGVVYTETFDADLPIVVFEVGYQLEMREARMKGTLTYDGGLENAVMGGRVPFENLMEIAVRADIEAGGILDAVELILPDMLDMGQDESGNCTQLSAALTFSAVSAFLYPEDMPKAEVE